jgi:hypothetical protein
VSLILASYDVIGVSAMSYTSDRPRPAAANACRLGLLLLIAAAPARAQISPGELSTAHSSLNGSAHCTDCHDRGKRPPEFKCLSCHKDIRERLESGRGLHPSLVETDRTQRSCAQCHVEHNGKDFALIHWSVPLQQFDHGRTGYLLEGRHAALACRFCHQPEHISAAETASLSIKDKTRTYLGLSRRCVSCHVDAHQGQLAMDCERCHTQQDWKKPTRFDHNKTHFRIDGAHQKVACDQCHTASGPGKAAPRYVNISFEDCAPCHRDPHAGAFKNPCRTCHSSQAMIWTPVETGATFDHSRTRFPLMGKHRSIACKACHIRGNFSAPLTYAQCMDCHKKDPHRGQFLSAPLVRDCDDCHTVQGFKPATFGVAQHAATRFPLKERHAEMACPKCHIPSASAEVVYRFQNSSCIACHRDPHGQQFAGEPYSNRCEDCHTERTFKPSTFTAPRHDAARFPLSGGHANVSCDKCHLPDLKPVRFRFEDRNCTVCHRDPHGLAPAAAQAGVPLSKAGERCQICHTVNKWDDLKKFDHSDTRFPLEGKHRGLACIKCHQPVAGAGVKNLSFKAASTQCAACHEDPHDGQFASKSSTIRPDGSVGGCGNCHSAASWHELRGFNHAATDFPLQGAHQEVPCAKCHPARDPNGGVKGLDYVRTSTRCFSCHEDIHGGQFLLDAGSADCTQCHQTQKWKPSEFNHETQSSYALTGAHRKVACGSCHSKVKEISGKKIIVYRGTARECLECHQSDTTGERP